MDTTGHTAGVTIENVSYAGVWNQTMPIPLEVPNIKGSSMPRSPLKPPDSPRLTLKINERLLPEQKGEGPPHAANPFWSTSVYTEEEIAAIREADKLDPILAEYYEDLLDD